jgi:thioredoxin-like negative regulator of GroEL|tara:strand:+ start:1166 stop:1627 length:462 start_codon:yes stop_codon:yes gene_type:complete
MQIIELNNSSFNKQKIKELLTQKICLVGIFSKLCIHCQNMKPQWEYLKKKLKKTKCNGLLLEIDSDQLNYIDYSSLNNSIKGFPAIMVFKNGKLKKEYNGNRRSDDMFKFFKPYMVLMGKSPQDTRRLNTRLNGKTAKKRKNKTPKNKTHYNR